MFNFDGKFYVMADELAELMDELRRRELEAHLSRLKTRALSTSAAFHSFGIAAGEAARVMASLSRLFPAWDIKDMEN